MDTRALSLSLVIASVIATVTGSAPMAFGATVKVAKSVNPACLPSPTPVPTPRPTPQATPTPVPGSTPAATPLPTPLATPVAATPPKPKPPANLPEDGPEPKSLGAAILDKALAGEASKAYLPFWHGYPWQKVAGANQWTAYLVAKLRTDGRELLESKPGDIKLYCANYSTLSEENRLLFWARVISVLAESESSYNPLLVTYEPTIGKGVFSTGLLQLSLASARGSNYDCDMIKTQDDLFDWRKNMSCSLKIMGYWVKRDGVITTDPKEKDPQSYKGIARYWQPFRESRLKTLAGRACVDEIVGLRLADWKTEANSSRHPAYYDKEYKKAGEKKFETVLRLINEFPPCHN